MAAELAEQQRADGVGEWRQRPIDAHRERHLLGRRLSKKVKVGGQVPADTYKTVAAGLALHLG
jgi:hypothetical protein